MLKKNKTIWDFISIDEIKEFLRVDHSEDNALIKTLFEAAVEKLEQYINKTIIRDDYEIIIDNHNSTFIELPHKPVSEVRSISIINDTSTQTIAYSLIRDVVILGFIPYMPLKIIYTAGMISSVLPPLLKVVLFEITSHFYENGNDKDMLSSILTKLHFFRDFKL